MARVRLLYLPPYNAPVMQLEDMADLKSVCCEFESHHLHQLVRSFNWQNAIFIKTAIVVQTTPHDRMIAAWCNGNTPDFDSGISGSNPGAVANLDKDFCTSGRETMRGAATSVYAGLNPASIRPRTPTLGAHVPKGRRCFASTVWWVQFSRSPPIKVH